MSHCSYFKTRMASRALNQGKLIAYPTEAVYGLGCDPLNETAVMNLLSIKQRPIHKGLILIAADFAQLQPYINPSPAMLERMLPSWLHQLPDCSCSTLGSCLLKRQASILSDPGERSPCGATAVFNLRWGNHLEQCQYQ